MSLDVLQFMSLFPAFAGPSWDAWRTILRATFALPMDAEQLATFQALTGRTEAPTQPAKEAWVIAGRRSGKSITAALVATYIATTRTFRLAPGERGVLMVLASDRRQARVIRRYVGGLLESTPVLAALVDRQTREAIVLKNGIEIEIHTSSYRSVRGYTVVAAICDEIAFWASEDSADPDREVLAALRPATATVPDALLVCLSSPHARVGEAWRTHEAHFAKDGDPVLVVQGATRTLNPTVPQALVDAALAADPAAARAEWLAEFRSDVESFVTREALERCVDPTRPLELPPARGTRYHAFVDPSGGRHDSFTLAIGHVERADDGSDVLVVDVARELRSPFNPTEAVAEDSVLLRSYGVDQVTGDRYGGSWPEEAFKRCGITYVPAAKPKSDLYGDALALLYGERVELAADRRLVEQIVGLERRVGRGGRDSIDHPPNGADDVANAVLGLAATVLVGEALAPKASRFAVLW
ncbi:MAG: hypothetical protein U0599_29075 [Vicinamibacteria bacterium]